MGDPIYARLISKPKFVNDTCVWGRLEIMEDLMGALVDVLLLGYTDNTGDIQL